MKIGTTTFQLTGSIPAGSTTSFSTKDGSLTSGTIQGKGNARIMFTGLEIVE